MKKLSILFIVLLFAGGCSEDDKTIDFEISSLFQVEQSTRMFSVEREISKASLGDDFADREEDLTKIDIRKLTFKLESWADPSGLELCEVKIGRVSDSMLTTIGVIEELDLESYVGGGQALMDMENEDYLEELLLDLDDSFLLAIEGEASGVPLDFTVRIIADIVGEY